MVGLFLSLAMSYSSAAPIVSTVPDITNPSFNQSVVVSVNIDLSAGSDSIGAYSMEISWDPAVLDYVNVAGGTSNGFTTLNKNEANTGSGSLLINNFYTAGNSGLLNVARITFTTVGGANDSTLITPTVTALSSYWDFTDLTPGLVIQSGKITIPQPSVTVTSPNGGESWIFGTSESITWTATNVANVSIEYSNNGGAGWTVITSSVSASTGSYPWSVPNTPSTSCLVRITDTTNPTVTDQSNGTFTIVGPEITVSPTSVAIGNVPVGDNNTGSFTITNEGNPDLVVSNISSDNSVFTVNPSSATIAPGDSQVVTVTFSPITSGSQGATITVTSNDNNEGTVNVSASGMGTAPEITVAPTTIAIGSVAVGSSNSGSFTMRNDGDDDLVVSNISSNNGVFTVNPSSATITPSDSQVVTVTFSPTSTGSDSATITVTSNDSDEGTVNVNTSGTGIAPEITVAPLSLAIGSVLVGSNNSGSFTITNEGNADLVVSNINSNNGVFTVNPSSATIASADSQVVTVTFSPTTTGSQSATITVTSNDSDEGTVNVNASGTGVAPEITVSPLSIDIGDVLVGGSDWETFTITNEGSTDLVVSDISSNNGVFTVSPFSTTITPGNNQVVTVTFSPTASGSESATITVTSNDSDEGTVNVSASGTGVVPQLTLSSPNGGEVWIMGTTRNITWNSAYISNVRLEYSNNGGANWTEIISSVSASTGSYSWTIPDDPSTNCLVKITNISDTLITDESNNSFTLRLPSSVMVISPNGTENWTAGNVETITWAKAYVDSVKIEYSTDGGSSWTNIVSSISASLLSYSWTIPNTPSSTCLVKITDTSDALVTDQSNGNFTILPPPSVTVTYPNGGEEFIGNISYNILWTYTNVANVRIEYSLNSGSNWTTITETAASAGSYSWTVPDISLSTCLVKITDTSDASVTDQSNSTFTISENGVWGDIDNNDNVDVVDALKISTYEIEPLNEALAPIEIYILRRGDVDASSQINIVDALICASYELNPDNPNLPPRVGNSIALVAKASPFVSTLSKYRAIPSIDVHPAENGEYSIATSIRTDNPEVTIGAASIRIKWDANKYHYRGLDSTQENLVINNKLAHTGELLMARIEVNGENPFDFPLIRLQPYGENVSDYLTFEILNASAAESFETPYTENGLSIRASIGNSVPTHFELKQNIPNPFNPSTSIHFAVSKPAHIQLFVYNIQGQKIKTLVDRFEKAGVYKVVWDATDENGDLVGSGIYIYQLSTTDFRAQKSMLLLR